MTPDWLAKFPRPFKGHYGISLTVAVLARVPFIIATTAYVLFTGQVVSVLGTDRTSIQIIAAV